MKKIFAFLFLCLLSGFSLPAFSQADLCQPAKSALMLSQNWLIKGQAIREDSRHGLFAYIFMPYSQTYPDEDNMVRQMGAFWALAHSLSYHDTPAVRESLMTFRKALVPYIEYAKADGEDIAYPAFDHIGKINAAALYLLALSELQERGLPLTDQEKEDIPKIVNGLRKMETDNGRFMYIYFLPQEKNKVTDYGTAEVYFALETYAKIKGDSELQDYIDQRFKRYFDSGIANETDMMSDAMKGYLSWGFYALSIRPELSEAQYNQYIRPLILKLLAYQENNDACRNKGCLYYPNTIDAPFVEGLSSVFKWVKRYEKEPDLRVKTEQALTGAIQHLLAFQVTDTHRFSEITGHKYIGREDVVRGGFCFNQTCATMRNDNNQHAMMALSGYLSSLCSSPDN